MNTTAILGKPPAPPALDLPAHPPVPDSPGPAPLPHINVGRPGGMGNPFRGMRGRSTRPPIGRSEQQVQAEKQQRQAARIAAQERAKAAPAQQPDPDALRRFIAAYGSRRPINPAIGPLDADEERERRLQQYRVRAGLREVHHRQAETDAVPTADAIAAQRSADIAGGVETEQERERRKERARRIADMRRQAGI